MLKRLFSINSLALAFEENPYDRLARIAQKTPKETYGMPWSFEGQPPKDANLRYLADRVFVQNDISVPGLMYQFYKQWTGVWKAIGDGNLSSVED
jgi:hypothetical protein